MTKGDQLQLLSLAARGCCKVQVRHYPAGYPAAEERTVHKCCQQVQIVAAHTGTYK
jgi:hypothetical protein